MRVLILAALLCSSFISAGQVELINQGFTTYGGNTGGKDEFRHIFEHEVYIPESEFVKGEEVKVLLGFEVTDKGILRGITVVQSGGEVFDREAIRILKLMEFDPAIYMDRPQATHHKAEFSFHPKKLAKLYKKRGYGLHPSLASSDTSGMVFDTPEVYAEPEGGNMGMMNFMRSNLVYPAEARAKNINGDVLLTFVVEPSGYASNIRIKKTLGGGCEQEAIRVVRLMKWTPATQEGKAVRSRVTLPVTFNLSNAVHNGMNSEQRTY